MARSANIVYPRGTREITVPATESIAVRNFGGDSCKVYRQLGYPDIPSSWSLLGTVEDEETVFGSYTDGATIRINAGADTVHYAVGVSPTTVDLVRQPTPTAETTAVTLTAAELLTRIVTGTHTVGATAAYTLPTGTLMDAAVEFAVDGAFEWSLINLSAAAADTITLTAASGHTIVGIAEVASSHATTGGLYGSSARWLTRKTAANTFVTYRIA